MRVAVVTGAARGFGYEIARRLVERGDRVVLTDLGEEDAAAAAARLGPRARGMAADASDPAAHRRVAAAAAELGMLTGWVNNAGVLAPGVTWEHTDEEIQRAVAVNLLGVVYGSRAAVDVMRERGGHVLNVASMSAFGPVPGLAVYAATKAAVLAFTLSLQGDLDRARVPVRVHALCPDAADTAMVRDEQQNPSTAILHSGAGLLDPGVVADAAVTMLDGRRLVRSMPRYRAVLARTGALVPTVGLRALAAARWLGERHRVQRRT